MLLVWTELLLDTGLQEGFQHRCLVSQSKLLEMRNLNWDLFMTRDLDHNPTFAEDSLHGSKGLVFLCLRCFLYKREIIT